MERSIVAFGEILLRLSPSGDALLSTAKSFDASFGGTESNVLVTLSGLGHKTRYVSVIPQNSFGVAVEQHLHKYKIDTTFVLKQGELLGTYYLEQGFGNRTSSVIYNRKSSEITHIDESIFSDKEYDLIFEGCELFHISGISFGLSEGCRRLSYRMIKEAKNRGIAVSFDCNYRAKVWGEYPVDEYAKIMKQADIIFCSQRDLDAMGIDNVEKFFSESQCRYLCKREKENISNDEISAQCSVLTFENGKVKEYTCEPIAFKVKEKIGGGDAFDAGMLHCLLNDTDIEKSMSFALGCYEMKHTVVGDILWVTKQQMADFLKNKTDGKGVIR